MEGWIKVHRKILDNPVISKDADYLSVWIYLLLNATHKEIPVIFKGKKILLIPGQLITGRKSISDDLSISESKIYRILNDFKSEQQIKQQTSNKNSLITILKWNEYQNNEQQNEQQMNNKRTTNEQPVNTNKNVRMKEYINNNNINNFINGNENFEKNEEAELLRKEMNDKVLKVQKFFRKRGVNWDVYLWKSSFIKK